IEELPGGAYEGQPLQVFLFSRPLTDEHHAGAARAACEHGLPALSVEPATLASPHLVLDELQPRADGTGKPHAARAGRRNGTARRRCALLAGVRRPCG